jgi:hypothetical protein
MDVHRSTRSSAARRSLRFDKYVGLPFWIWVIVAIALIVLIVLLGAINRVGRERSHWGGLGLARNPDGLIAGPIRHIGARSPEADPQLALGNHR